MDADARIEIRMCAGDRVHGVPAAHFDGDAERVRDVVVAHRVEHLRQLVAELWKIEMAMRIDEHR
jgi:hypothetical protein